jgi:hypothetical protein
MHYNSIHETSYTRQILQYISKNEKYHKTLTRIKKYHKTLARMANSTKH